MVSEYRFNSFVDKERKILIVRPIGDMPGAYFVDKLFEFYARVDAPWTFNRVSDLRRFDGKLCQADLDKIAELWVKLADGHAYHAHVAVVSLDRLASFRVAAVSSQFPNETICVFTDYHEAIAWLLATDKDAFLAGLETQPTETQSTENLANRKAGQPKSWDDDIRVE